MEKLGMMVLRHPPAHGTEPTRAMAELQLQWRCKAYSSQGLPCFTLFLTLCLAWGPVLLPGFLQEQFFYVAHKALLPYPPRRKIFFADRCLAREAFTNCSSITTNCLDKPAFGVQDAPDKTFPACWVQIKSCKVQSTFCKGMNTFDPQRWLCTDHCLPTLNLWPGDVYSHESFTSFELSHCFRTGSLQSKRKRAKAAVWTAIAKPVEFLRFCNKSSSHCLYIWADMVGSRWITRSWCI